jgi:hypothetical protein
MICSGLWRLTFMGLLLAKSGWWGSSHKHWFRFWGPRQQGVDAGELPGRLGIRAERWQEICGACSVRVVAFGGEVLGID